MGSSFAIVGFDDIAEASLSNPPLTTVKIDAESIGRVAAQRLLARIEGDMGPPQRVIIPAHLLVRASCGASQKNPVPPFRQEDL